MNRPQHVTQQYAPPRNNRAQPAAVNRQRMQAWTTTQNQTRNSNARRTSSRDGTNARQRPRRREPVEKGENTGFGIATSKRRKGSGGRTPCPAKPRTVRSAVRTEPRKTMCLSRNRLVALARPAPGAFREAVVEGGCALPGDAPVPGEGQFVVASRQARSRVRACGQFAQVWGRNASAAQSVQA